MNFQMYQKSKEKINQLWSGINGRLHKNETALINLISNINKQFYYIGEENDKVAPIDVKKFTQCVGFIDSLEVDYSELTD